VSEPVKAERLARLQALLEDQRQAFNASCVGREMDVLFDRAGRKHGQVAGRSPYLQPVQIEAEDVSIGDIRRVRITERGTNSLFGTLVDNQSKRIIMEAVA
jgi:tRNA-2-methylthio-N6-dimethylallyladenosine synthase